VRGVEEAEQERDRDGLHARRLSVRDQRGDLLFGERRDDGAIRADPLGQLEAAPARDQGRRRVLEQVIEIGPRRAPQLQHVAEAAGRDQRGARAFFLEDGVVTTVVACDSRPTSEGATS